LLFYADEQYSRNPPRLVAGEQLGRRFARPGQSLAVLLVKIRRVGE
jgi:hypothetical protein